MEPTPKLSREAYIQAMRERVEALLGKVAPFYPHPEQVEGVPVIEFRSYFAPRGAEPSSLST
jgi:hypothetical protein